MSGLRLCVRDVYAYSFAFVGFGRFLCMYVCMRACMHVHTYTIPTHIHGFLPSGACAFISASGCQAAGINVKPSGQLTLTAACKRLPLGLSGDLGLGLLNV